MIENYDYIKVPGLTEITIPVVKRKGELLDEEGASRTPDWVVSIEGEGGITRSTLDQFPAIIPSNTDTLEEIAWKIEKLKQIEQKKYLKSLGRGISYGVGTSLENHTELFGWYARSAHYLKKNSVNNQYSSGVLWHSDVFLVVQNGSHNAYVNYCIAEGIITNEISISRLIKKEDEFLPTQTLIFNTCQWCGVYSYMEYSILRFTACIRENICLCVDQYGSFAGRCACAIDYASNQNLYYKKDINDIISDFFQAA